MYEKHFHLTENPFRLTPDPRFLYFTEKHRECLSALVYGVLAHKGFLVVTGDAGTGKTTIIHTILGMLTAKKVACAFVFHPLLEPVDFLELVLVDLGITPPSRHKGEMLRALHQFLLKRGQEGTTTALIIDEAHRLSPALLEEVRLFSNLETSRDKLLQVVMAGQSELDDVFRQEQMRQLKQRISIRTRLTAFTVSQTVEYLQHRVGLCGRNAGELFPPKTLPLLYQFSRGIPRLINSICDNALLLAFAQQAPAVTTDMMLEVGADLDLLGEIPVRPVREPSTITEARETPIPNGPAPARATTAASGGNGPLPTAFKTLDSYGERKGTINILSRWADKFRPE